MVTYTAGHGRVSKAPSSCKDVDSVAVMFFFESLADTVPFDMLTASEALTGWDLVKVVELDVVTSTEMVLEMALVAVCGIVSELVSRSDTVCDVPIETDFEMASVFVGGGEERVTSGVVV